MPTFQFDDGTAADRANASGQTFSLDVSDDGVTFTVSTTGNDDSGPFVNSASFVPDIGGGAISISDDSVGGVITLDINAGGAPLTNFGGTGSGTEISLQLGSVSSSLSITFVHETNTALNQVFAVTGNDDNRLINFAAGANTYSQIQFTSSPGGYFMQIQSLTASIVCYLEGTGIETPTGRVTVENLKSGDLVTTADGGTTRVNWIGVQPVDVRQSTPAKVNPICFVADSIASGVPSRDLLVSPDHAIEIDGMLYNAHALVNGKSIYQKAQMPLDGFTYYHIDTGAHELILAEDCPSETYLDAVGRDAFINGAEVADAPIITEMALPRIAAKRMVPTFVTEALASRADMLITTKATQAA